MTRNFENRFAIYNNLTKFTRIFNFNLMKVTLLNRYVALMFLAFSLSSFVSLAAPVANSDSNSGTEDQIIIVLAIQNNDLANGGTLVASTIDLNPSVTGNQSTFSSANGQWSVDYLSGHVTFVPNTNFNGVETINYTIENSLGQESNIAQITVTLSAVNDAPHITNNLLSIVEDAGIQNGNLLGNGDNDAEGTTLLCNTTPVVNAANGIFTVTANGVYTYTANTNFNGTDMVVVQVCDQGLPLPGLCVNDTLFIDITTVNDGPNAVNDNFNVIENSITLLSPLLNDTDIDNPLDQATLAILYGPFHGTASILNSGIVYTPDLNFIGQDSMLYQICDSAAPLTSICDQAYIHINVLPCATNPSADCDGDGVTNATEVSNGTDPNNPCSYTVASQTLVYGSVWVNADCDGDGYTNGTELGLNTNFNENCSFPFIAQNATPTTIWSGLDCDGDGVTNGDEVQTGTNASYPCDFYAISITLTPSITWMASDCDGDGVTNATEITDNTNPTNECSLIPTSITVVQNQLWFFFDCDGDGVQNGDELQDSTYYLDVCNYLSTSVTMPQSSLWMQYDCDGDGVINQDEMTDNTDAQDGCEFLVASQTVLTSSIWNAWDCDEDGVINATETTDNTNLNDPCSFLATSITLPVGDEYNNADCDADGLNNSTEGTLTTNPFNPDTDGDGLNDGQEVAQGSDPLDACDPVASNSTCLFIIPGGLSPNGDTYNDVFEIIGAANFPNNKLTIYNRYGNEVYTFSPGYTNQWVGQSNSTMNLGGDKLPDGVYFYVFDKFGDGKDESKGSVYLKNK